MVILKCASSVDMCRKGRLLPKFRSGSQVDREEKEMEMDDEARMTIRVGGRKPWVNPINRVASVS